MTNLKVALRRFLAEEPAIVREPTFCDQVAPLARNSLQVIRPAAQEELLPARRARTPRLGLR